MNNRYDITPYKIREFALAYLFFNKEATASQINDAIEKDPEKHIDTSVHKVTKALSNHEFFDSYKNKQRVNVYFIKQEVYNAIKG